MLSSTKILFGSAFCAAGVAAHGGVLSYNMGGVTYNGFVPYNTEVGQSTIQRIWNTYNPIQDVTQSIIACNDDGTSPDSQLTANVTSGVVVTGYWNNPWPHNTGPMLAYLGQCPSSGCTGVNVNGLSWFKIAHSGLLSGTVYNGTWAAGQMINNNSSWTITIPSSVPSGYYLLRMETIALHSQPAQNYPECAQLKITNSGTSIAPASSLLVKFPGAYSQTDPGLDIDIYGQAAQTQTTYIIPGPPLYPGGGSSTTTTTTTTKSTTTTTTTTTTTKSSSTSSSSSSTGGCSVAKYGQCGGSGWTGCTVCASGSTCTYSNAYYSQCL